MLIVLLFSKLPKILLIKIKTSWVKQLGWPFLKAKRLLRSKNKSSLGGQQLSCTAGQKLTKSPNEKTCEIKQTNFAKKLFLNTFHKIKTLVDSTNH